MARRGMFNPVVTETDKFTSLSTEAQALYFHLGLNTDTIGAISGVRRLVGSYGFSNPSNALTELIDNGYLIETSQEGESVFFITHWWVNNVFDIQKTSRSSYYQLALDFFEEMRKGEPYKQKTDSSPVSESLTAVSISLTNSNSNGDGKDTDNSKQAPLNSTSNGNQIKDKENEGKSLKGEPSIPCPSCGGETIQGNTLNGYVHIECPTCGMTYINPETGEIADNPYYP